MGRKSNATLAAEAAAKEAAEAAKGQELAKIETVDGKKVVTDLEPVSKPVDPETEIKAVLEAPVSASVDPNGEDLGDVSSNATETSVIDAGAATTPNVVVYEQDSQATKEQQAITDAINKEIVEELTAKIADTSSFEYVLEDDFVPILRPTMVGDSYTGHIPCPKAVFDLVQNQGWQSLIDAHPAKHGLKSVLYWKRKNGSAVVRCMSSSRFADVV